MRKKVNIFISYSTDDKELAGQFKDELESYRMKCFLAHEDIEPSEEWEKRILSELRRADVFIPIITKNFCRSKWTDQEAGIAIEREILIIPLKTNQNPHGFLSRYQALSLKYDVIYTCFDIIKIIVSKRNFGIQLKNLIVKKFVESRSYRETSAGFDFLFSFNNFTPHQVTQILKSAMINKQIYGYNIVKKRIAKFLRKYGNKANRSLINECKKFFEDK